MNTIDLAKDIILSQISFGIASTIIVLTPIVKMAIEEEKTRRMLERKKRRRMLERKKNKLVQPKKVEPIGKMYNIIIDENLA